MMPGSSHTIFAEAGEPHMLILLHLNDTGSVGSPYRNIPCCWLSYEREFAWIGDSKNCIPRKVKSLLGISPPKKNLETTRWLDEHWIWNWLALCHSAIIFFVNFSQHPRSRQMICQWYGPWEFGCTIHGHHGENGPDNHGIFEQMCFFLSLFHDISLFLTIFSMNSGAKCREDELRHLNLLGLREFQIHGQHHQSVAAWLGWVAFF